MSERITRVFGAELKVGDVIKVWWQPGRDVITSLKPYQGPYEKLPGWEGVRVATFVRTKTGMTIFPGELEDRIDAVNDED